MTTEEVENEVKEVAVKATKALSNATYTKEEALALEKEIRDAVNRTRGKIVQSNSALRTPTLQWLTFSVNSAGYLVNTNTFYGPLSVLLNGV